MVRRVLALLLRTKAAKICSLTSRQSSRTASSLFKKINAFLLKSLPALKASKLQTFSLSKLNQTQHKIPGLPGIFFVLPPAVSHSPEGEYAIQEWR
jgi:hypothetical protein